MGEIQMNRQTLYTENTPYLYSPILSNFYILNFKSDYSPKFDKSSASFWNNNIHAFRKYLKLISKGNIELSLIHVWRHVVFGISERIFMWLMQVLDI